MSERQDLNHNPTQDLRDCGSSAPAETRMLQEWNAPNWVVNSTALWERRSQLVKTSLIALILGLMIVFLLPKRYESSARIMPPGSSMGGAAFLAALSGRAGGVFGGLGSLAGGLMGGGGNTSLFIDLLRSGTVSGHLIDRFDLQKVYHMRYRVDAAKYLAKRTVVVDDKKSGVITVTVTDGDPVRARDITQAYLDELNLLVTRTNTSSAHQERLFIEKRLQGVQSDLGKAQQRLSEFSSTHAAVDIKEQTRALVDAASRVQSQLIVEESELDSIREIYGDENVRVRATRARIGVLKAEIGKMGGTSKALPAVDVSQGTSAESGEQGLYPPLRQLPRLAVPYADFYREVRVQEAVNELLTQQYEVARIQEAKDVPVVSVIDAPGVPEKKSFPPRLLLAVVFVAICVTANALVVLVRLRWEQVGANDPRRVLISEITYCGHQQLQRIKGITWFPYRRGA